MLVRHATVEDCDALGLITVTASLKSFLGNVPEEEFDFAWTPEASATNWRKYFDDEWPPERLFWVAEINDRVVGYVIAGELTEHPEYERSVNGLYLLPSIHGQGMGRALLSHAASSLSAVGVTSWLIGCLKDNPSCGFYRHLGGVEIYRLPNKMDNYHTEEIFFGWKDIKLLIA